jgi:aarF domain-containing kinase
MAGRRFVDAAKLFGASKSVAGKHIALRSSQLDAFNKTSTVAKAVKNQTDRFTLTAAAAIELSKRFSEEAPSYARKAAQQAASTGTSTGARHEDIPRKETLRRDAPADAVEEGLQQDHHYDRSEHNTAVRPPPEGELQVEQKEAPRRPLPDGTIPTGDLTLEQEERGQDTFSERPIPEAPKEPLVEEQKEPRREEEGIRPVESDESTIPLPGKPRGDASAAAESIPSHANDLQPPNKSPRIQNLEAGHDRDVFYARSVETQPAPPTQPRTQLPKHTGTTQASDEHVDDKRLNQDVFYARDASKQATAIEEDMPEGINTDIFHSTRVAQMLGRDSDAPKDYPRRKLPPSRNPFIPPQYQAGHGHETTTRQEPKVTASEPSAKKDEPATSEEEMQDLASQLAQNTQSRTTAAPEVHFLHPIHTKPAD